MSARRPKITPSVAKVAAQPIRKWHIVGTIAALIVLMLAGAGAHLAWRSYRLPQRIEQDLGSTPDLSRSPAILQERVSKAEQLLRDRGTTLAGVAELGRLYHANGF